ncbi:MAG: hypothetical protein ACJAU3_001530, partial [Zhongshania sp.]
GLGMKPVLVLMSALLVTLDELQFENGKLGFRSQYS